MFAGYLVCQSVSVWYFSPNVNNRSSLRLGPVNCIPIGNPFFVNPHGMDREGIPDRLDGAAKISDKYILIGSSTFSPIKNGGVGQTGIRIESTFSKAFEKSLIINVRILAAFS